MNKLQRRMRTSPNRDLRFSKNDRPPAVLEKSAAPIGREAQINSRTISFGEQSKAFLKQRLK